jgi:hypothetical protein
MEGLALFCPDSAIPTIEGQHPVPLCLGIEQAMWVIRLPEMRLY